MKIQFPPNLSEFLDFRSLCSIGSVDSSLVLFSNLGKTGDFRAMNSSKCKRLSMVVKFGFSFDIWRNLSMWKSDFSRFSPFNSDFSVLFKIDGGEWVIVRFTLFVDIWRNVSMSKSDFSRFNPFNSDFLRLFKIDGGESIRRLIILSFSGYLGRFFDSVS
jgi:hypothetical protein